MTTSPDCRDGRYVLSIPNLEVRMSFDTLMSRIYCINIPTAINLLRHIIKKDDEASGKIWRHS